MAGGSGTKRGKDDAGGEDDEGSTNMTGMDDDKQPGGTTTTTTNATNSRSASVTAAFDSHPLHDSPSQGPACIVKLYPQSDGNDSTSAFSNSDRVPELILRRTKQLVVTACAPL